MSTSWHSPAQRMSYLRWNISRTVSPAPGSFNSSKLLLPARAHHSNQHGPSRRLPRHRPRRDAPSPPPLTYDIHQPPLTHRRTHSSAAYEPPYPQESTIEADPDADNQATKAALSTLKIDAVPATLQALQSVVRKQLLDANPNRNFDSVEARERTQECLRARRYLTKLINGVRGVNRE